MSEPTTPSPLPTTSKSQSDLSECCDWLECKLRGAVLCVLWVVIFQLLFAVYKPALPGPFVYDDEAGIVTNTDLRFPKEPWRVLRDHESSIEFDRRPVTAMVTMLDFQLWGLRSPGYRITNVLLHFSCGIAVAALIATISKGVGCRFSRLYGHIVAVLWLFHPLSTSTVSFIYQRSEILMSLFYVLALLFLYRAYGSERKWRWLSASLACAFLSALSKEPGLTLIAALPLLERVCIFQSWKQLWKARKVYYVILLIGIGDITAWVLTGVRMTDLHQKDFILSHPWEYFKGQCLVLVRYLKLVVWPHPLIFLADPGGVGGFFKWFPSFVLLCSLTGILIWAGLRNNWIWLCLGGFLILLAPTSSFIPIPMEPDAEFRMYLPSMFILAGLIAALGPLMFKLKGGKVAAYGLSVVLTVGAIVGSAVRNRVYSTAVGLWTDSVQKAPHAGRAWINLSMAAINSGNFALARQCSQEMIIRGSRHSSTELVLAGERVAAFVELEDGDAKKALAMIVKVAADDSKAPGVQLGLASAYEKIGQHDNALKILEKYYPDPVYSNPAASLIYREVYLAKGLLSEAAIITNHLDRLMPGFAEAINQSPRARANAAPKDPKKRMPDQRMEAGADSRSIR